MMRNNSLIHNCHRSHETGNYIANYKRYDFTSIFFNKNLQV